MFCWETNKWYCVSHIDFDATPTSTEPQREQFDAVHARLPIYVSDAQKKGCSGNRSSISVANEFWFWCNKVLTSHLACLYYETTQTK